MSAFLSEPIQLNIEIPEGCNFRKVRRGSLVVWWKSCSVWQACGTLASGKCERIFGA